MSRRTRLHPRPRRVLPRLSLLLAAAGVLLSGCVSFSGPNDIRNQIARAQNVTLEKEQGLSVGPLGIALAGMLAGPYLPFDISGISSVDFGQYTIRAHSADPTPLRLGELDMKGYETIVRVREGDSDMAIMVNDDTDRLRRILFMQREGRFLQIVRATGDFERLIDAALDADLIGDDWLPGPARRDDDGRDEVEDEIERGGDADGAIPITVVVRDGTEEEIHALMRAHGSGS